MHEMEDYMDRNDKEFLVEKIRTQYTEKGHTELDSLKELDACVKRPANIFAYVFGSLGALIMGTGMSLVMTDIGENIGMENVMFPGIVIGLIGLIMVLADYPIYKKILETRKRQYAGEILKLSEKILENK